MTRGDTTFNERALSISWRVTQVRSFQSFLSPPLFLPLSLALRLPTLSSLLSFIHINERALSIPWGVSQVRSFQRAFFLFLQLSLSLWLPILSSLLSSIHINQRALSISWRVSQIRLGQIRSGQRAFFLFLSLWLSLQTLSSFKTNSYASSHGMVLLHCARSALILHTSYLSFHPASETHRQKALQYFLFWISLLSTVLSGLSAIQYTTSHQPFTSVTLLPFATVQFRATR